jgi:maltodextrin utilization protein YvdJ
MVSFPQVKFNKPTRSGSSVRKWVDDCWLQKAEVRTRLTMRWATGASLIGLALSFLLDRGFAFALAAASFMLALFGLALHQSLVRSGA